MIRAVLGKLASWGKLARTGTARLPGQEAGVAVAPAMMQEQIAE